MSSRFVPPDSPRLLDVIRFFELTGTPLQIKTADLAESLGMPAQAVSRWVGWAEKYGILEVERTAAGFATGRTPNTYTLRIGLDQWAEQGETIVAGLRTRPEKPAEVKSLPSTPGGPDDLAGAVKAEASELVQAALEEAGPIPEVAMPGPMPQAEVDHWRTLED